MSYSQRATNSVIWDFRQRADAPELEEVIDPLALTDDYPIVDDVVDGDDALDEELEGSFPASDAPSSTPTTSIGAPEHVKGKS
jgi:hypothetical protein